MASGSERTQAVLTPLWDLGPGTVSDVQSRLSGDLAYTTVQTMLGVLLRKNKVRRQLAGRAFVYRPAVTREGASATALADMVTRVFGGSGEALLMSLVDTRQITPEALARAARLLAGEEEAT